MVYFCQLVFCHTCDGFAGIIAHIYQLLSQLLWCTFVNYYFWDIIAVFIRNTLVYLSQLVFCHNCDALNKINPYFISYCQYCNGEFLSTGILSYLWWVWRDYWDIFTDLLSYSWMDGAQRLLIFYIISQHY